MFEPLFKVNCLPNWQITWLLPCSDRQLSWCFLLIWLWLKHCSPSTTRSEATRFGYSGDRSSRRSPGKKKWCWVTERGIVIIYFLQERSCVRSYQSHEHSSHHTGWWCDSVCQGRVPWRQRRTSPRPAVFSQTRRSGAASRRRSGRLCHSARCSLLQRALQPPRPHSSCSKEFNEV